MGHRGPPPSRHSNGACPGLSLEATGGQGVDGNSVAAAAAEGVLCDRSASIVIVDGFYMVGSVYSAMARSVILRSRKLPLERQD